MIWESNARIGFDQIIAKVPVFMRPIAQEKVSQKAEALVNSDNRKEVTEKDMINAFFEATPFGFHGPLKNDMQALGIDYTKYGHER